MKKILSVALILIMCLTLCSCGISKEDAVGTWSGSYTYNGNEFGITFDLNADGSYKQTTLKNSTLYRVERGTWDVIDGEVRLDPDDDPAMTYYQYKGKALVNNDHKFYKIK